MRAPSSWTRTWRSSTFRRSARRCSAHRAGPRAMQGVRYDRRRRLDHGRRASVATRIGYRVAFAIGVGALGVSLGLGFAQALRRSGRPPALLVDPLVEAQREFAGSDPERWIGEARSLTEIQPRNLGAYLALGRGLSDAGRVDQAIRAYETALGLGRVPPMAHA